MVKATTSQEPYGSFDSAETARKETGGRVYQCRGYEGHAIIVEDQSGRNWLYVKPESTKYRDASNEVWGHRMSEDGRDADHIASRGIEANLGQGYVLMGAVDRSANRSHGSYEKPGRHLDRSFNAAAQQTEPDRLALRISYRQSHKIVGRGKGDLEADKSLNQQVRPGVGDPDFDRATFGSAEHQANLESMKGKEIGFDFSQDRSGDHVTKLYEPPRFGPEAKDSAQEAKESSAMSTSKDNSAAEKDEAYEAELARLRAAEEQKRSMYRDVEDPNTLTPDRKFVEKHLGPEKTDAQLQAEARAHADKLRQQAEAEALRREAVDKSMRVHNARLQEEKADREAAQVSEKSQSAADRHRAQKGKAPEQVKSKEKSR